MNGDDVNARAPTMLRIAPLLFLITGASGLVYQTVWMRMLIRVFGVTVYATTTVVAVFMAGLAIGAVLGGAYAARRGATLRAWGVLEMAAGLVGLVATVAIRALPSLYAAWSADAPLDAAVLTAANDTVFVDSVGASRVPMRVLLASACLLPPTLLMGATLPFLVGAVKARMGGATVARLYGANTIGAVIGVLGVGFVLIGALGEMTTVLVAVALHVGVGAAAALTPARLTSAGDPAAAAATPADDEPRVDEPSTWSTPALLVAASLAGAAALACEIAWTRLLVFVVGSSVYAFSSMLGMYLLGIGIGSLVIAPRLSTRALPLLFAALGCTTALSLRVFLVLGLRADGVEYTYSPLLEAMDAARFLLVSAAVVMPTTIVSGAMFPLLVRATSSHARATSSSSSSSSPSSSSSQASSQADGMTAVKAVGTVYAVNTVGGVVGALAAGFGAMPLIGAQGTVFFVSVAFFVAAVALALVAGRLRGRAGLAASAGGAAVVLLSLMVIAPSDDVTRAVVAGRLEPRGVMIRKHVETVDTTVTLAAGEGLPPSLFLNGILTSTKGPAGELMAHLPLLLHPEPHNALVICFGVGDTFRAASRHVSRVDVVELVGAVVAEFPTFDPQSTGLLVRPGTRIFIEDGRNHLLRTKERYGAILIDGAPPIYSAGFVNLYSKEMMELAREALDDHGVLMLWVPTKGYGDDVWGIIRSLTDVFPTTAMWTSDMSGWILLATKAPSFALDPETLAARIAERGERVPKWLTADYLVAPGQRRFVDDAALRNLSRDVEPVTDDRPRTEYPLARMIRGEPLLHNAADLFAPR